ncbi:MAG TPA: hypothetical protein VFU63_10020, partial [Ktedonobacterales bacterium]|nr:hypothetical protein [Ktedonobacterales bacterium]
LAEDNVDSDGRAILRSIVDAHTRHAAWCEQRAREFAETRQFEFRRPMPRPRDLSPGPGGNDPQPDVPDTSSERGVPHAATSPMAETGIEDAVTLPESPPAE